MVALFNGIFAPYSTFPHFWKCWMYYIKHLTWFSYGVLSPALPEVVVHCAEAESARFDPSAMADLAERDDKWPCLGYMIAFAVANWCLVCFFTYITKIKGWTFGFDHAANAMRRIKDKAICTWRRESVESADEQAYRQP
ncbi:hypothetical protein BFJ70_g6382 [Fusarium oxysporum]|nr:ATP-binding cassette transporter snq2 [Fusarium oxysporum]KAJ4270792.1 ATP-binding cassette transporter snq2 [Fusarium oxysporum]RKL38749.1 hypothetical protein BFJ70_g6382 [Fusarium oxysporum]